MSATATMETTMETTIVTTITPAAAPDAAARPRVRVRQARPEDVAAIVALVNGFADERVMLPRTPESVEASLDGFVVAVDEHEHVLACGALKEYSPSLAEVASVAVAASAHGMGLGRSVVAAVEALAVRRGIPELFALTLTPGFFERMGYAVSDRTLYPEKIRRDCLGCSRRAACAEVCVTRVLAGSSVDARWVHPGRLAA